MKKINVAKTVKTIVLFIYMSCGLTIAQKKDQLNIGTGIGTFVSGDGHGAYYSGYISINKNKTTVTVGPCIQKRSMQLKGGRVNFNYLLAEYERADSMEFLPPPNARFQLHVFSYFQYVDKLPLSYSASCVETITNPRDLRNWNEVKLSTATAAVGFELNVLLNKAILRFYIGAAAHYHINYISTMYHEKVSPALTLGAAITIPNLLK